MLPSARSYEAFLESLKAAKDVLRDRHGIDDVAYLIAVQAIDILDELRFCPDFLYLLKQQEPKDGTNPHKTA
jgi:chorismate mutase